jgi:hypothetical protein
MPRGPKGQRLSVPVEQRDEDSNKAKPRSRSSSHTKASCSFPLRVKAGLSKDVPKTSALPPQADQV